MTTFCLFDRHNLPKNEGAICEDFDFEDFRPNLTEKWFDALEILENGGRVELIVTGLTPALIAFIKQAYVVLFRNLGNCGSIPELTLLHYSKTKQRYVEQVIIDSIEPMELDKFGEYQEKLME